MLKVVQLTDCHLSADEEASYRGINPRQTLDSVLARVKTWRPDLLLVTGDLAEDGSKAVYEFLADTLSELSIPVLTVPGNHDCRSRQKEYFPLTASEEALYYDASTWGLILLNSAAKGQIPGVLSPPTLAGLENLLKDNSKPTLLVLHHQPVAVGSLWIDRYPLLQPHQLWSLLEGNNAVKAVLWGHIHHEYSAVRKDIILLGSPSTAANSLAARERFTFDPAGPACRWLELYPDWQLETSILKS